MAKIDYELRKIDSKTNGAFYWKYTKEEAEKVINRNNFWGIIDYTRNLKRDEMQCFLNELTMHLKTMFFYKDLCTHRNYPIQVGLYNSIKQIETLPVLSLRRISINCFKEPNAVFDNFDIVIDKKLEGKDFKVPQEVVLTGLYFSMICEKHHDLRIRLLEGGKYELCWIDNKLTHLGFKKINNIDEYLSECKS